MGVKRLCSVLLFGRHHRDQQRHDRHAFFGQCLCLGAAGLSVDRRRGVDLAVLYRAVQGLPVGTAKISVYALNGFCSALAGIVATIYTGSGNPSMGVGLELDAIAVVVIAADQKERKLAFTPDGSSTPRLAVGRS